MAGRQADYCGGFPGACVPRRDHCRTAAQGCEHRLLRGRVCDSQWRAAGFALPGVRRPLAARRQQLLAGPGQAHRGAVSRRTTRPGPGPVLRACRLRQPAVRRAPPSLPPAHRLRAELNILHAHPNRRPSSIRTRVIGDLSSPRISPWSLSAFPAPDRRCQPGLPQPWQARLRRRRADPRRMPTPARAAAQPGAPQQ
jgi:hypothetical protein